LFRVVMVNMEPSTSTHGRMDVRLKLSKKTEWAKN
jgi:hypothetical protein